MVIAKKIIVVNPFVGVPKHNDFDIVQEELSELQESGKFIDLYRNFFLFIESNLFFNVQV